MIRSFTWKEFDENVEEITNRCYKYKLSGIYGIPRGGICLAVALSHKLNLKLQNKPEKFPLIVDDIYETGLTLNKYKDIDKAKLFVLFSKIKPIWFEIVHILIKSEWIIFPWENKNNSINERTSYEFKRNLL